MDQKKKKKTKQPQPQIEMEQIHDPAASSEPSETKEVAAPDMVSTAEVAEITAEPLPEVTSEASPVSLEDTPKTLEESSPTPPETVPAVSDETGWFYGLADQLNKSDTPAADTHNEDTIWLGDLLSKPELGAEIGPDEQAISAAGLADISDMELEKILEEAKEADWGAEAPQSDQAPVKEFQDDEYREAFGEGQELEQMFTAQVPDEDSSISEDNNDEEMEDMSEYIDLAAYEAAANTPIKKGRPKRKKGYGLWGIPHILVTLVWLMIIVTIGVSLGRIMWVCAADLLAFGREEQLITVVIEEGDTNEDIANKLHDAGLIEYPALFKLYADLANVSEEAIPGTYQLNTLYDYHALSNAISYVSSLMEEVEVAIPEGFTCAQMFAFLESKGVCSAAELNDFAMNGDLGEYWFLEGLDRSSPNCLEGFLFPDTYMFYKNGSPAHVFKRLLDNFDRKFDDKLRAQVDTLNKTLTTMWKKNGMSNSYINSHKMTVRDVIVLASIVEKESASSAENYTIASVFYNRLTNPSNYPYLQSDATVVYALGGKSKLTAEDLKVDSPYNTYVTKGLPAGPICNPGLDSIKAALDPASTSYHYFIYDEKAGVTRFSKTLKEHQQWKNKLGGN